MTDTKKPTQLLTDEHRAVLQKLAALEKNLSNLDKREAISAELKELTSFFKTDFWVHFTKEEEALFPEMETFIPRNAGPIGVMLVEHEDLRKTNDVIQQAAADYLGGKDGEATRATLQTQGAHFIGLLRDHINKEDNILFMMANMHLSPQQMEKISALFDRIDGKENEGQTDGQGQTVIEALLARRSCKDFAPTPVPAALLTELVDVARYSPSGANKNAWRFVIVTEPAALARLGQISRAAAWLGSAQAAIAVVIDPKATRYWLEDCSVAAYSIWLAGEARGIGVAWAAMHQSDNAEESAKRQQAVREVLGLPAELYVPMVMGLGYRKSAPPEKKRPILEDIVAWERYPGG